MKDKKQATIYDVAREADVSLATVSRVINGSDRVKGSTRDKVNKVIEKLHYRPSAVARGLATNKTANLAVLLTDDVFSYMGELVAGISAVAQMSNYNVLVYTTGDLERQADFKDTIELLEKARVDGVIAFNSDDNKKLLASLETLRIPTVMVGCNEKDSGLPIEKISNWGFVSVDFVDIYSSLTSDYIKSGKSDIFFVTAIQNVFNQNNILDGIRKGFREINVNFQNVIEGYIEYEDNVSLFDEFFKAFKPNVLFCGHDLQAVAAIDAARKHGIKVPEEMEVWGWGNTVYGRVVTPKIPTINVSMFDAGAVAVSLLTKILNDETDSDSKIEGSIVPRVIKR